MITLDFETRSEADLPKVGSYIYAQDPTTEVLCLAWSYDDEDEVYLWHPAIPGAYRKKGTTITPAPLDAASSENLDELLRRVREGELLEAHNAAFECAMWAGVCAPRFDFPSVQPRQWRCSAAKAASFALPRDLKRASRALHLGQQKDDAGHRLMLKMCKPRKPWKSELDTGEPPGTLWHQERGDLDALFDYCRQDVRAERELSRCLRDLPPKELRIWQVDQGINGRGVPIDRAMVSKANALVEERRAQADGEIEALTKGDVTGCSKRMAFLDWLASEGLDLPDTQGATIDAYLAGSDLPDRSNTRRALELWREVNRTSVAKYKAMEKRMAGDDRVRDILLYHGASTGRWAGRGIQVQNFPRGNVRDMDRVCQDILDFEMESLFLVRGGVVDFLSGALRGAICAPAGRTLMASDYSSIETRVLFWLAGEESGLAVLRNGKDIYKDMAGSVYGVPPESIGKGEKRQVGKAAILGLGYQMGAPKFVDTALAMAGVTITEDFSQEVVDAYRARYAKVKALWWGMEAAAKRAVQHGPGARQPVVCNGISWAMRGRFLHAKLPSGRLLSYYQPRLEPRKTPWGEIRQNIVFWGMNFKNQWVLQNTYGGKLVENVVQAIARDLLADAMLRASEREQWDIVLHAHDELMVEVDEDKADLAELNAVLENSEPWADGLPVKAEGWVGRRFRK